MRATILAILLLLSACGHQQKVVTALEVKGSPADLHTSHNARLAYEVSW